VTGPSGTGFEVRYDPRAAKELSKLDPPTARRVAAAITDLAANPRPPGCRQLTGHAGLWRIRVGDYRVIYTIRETALVVLVLRVAHRRDAYRDV